MAKLLTPILVALVLGFSGIASADTLQMEGTTPDAGKARPTRGMTAERVEQTYGIPESRQAAVGDPPISRWEYKDFVVFFEYDRVIHAVAKRKPRG